MPVVSQATIDFVNGIAAEAERIDTPCGDGTMAWRCWGSGPPLVLLHGGYGSWMHWIRNVQPLVAAIHGYRAGPARSRRLGDPARAVDRQRACRRSSSPGSTSYCGASIRPEQEKLHLAGFSFGGVIGGSVAAQLGDRLRGFTVVGSNGLGLERSPTPLRRVPADADETEEFATHRYNLNQLMIADPDKIDELALYLQKTNHARARMRSRRFSRSGR